MNFSKATSKRGAARHWIIGCGVLFLLTIVISCAGIYFAGKALLKGMKVEPVNVANIPDPPKDADPAQIFPMRVGKYVRDTVTSDAASMQQYSLNGGVKGNSGVRMSSNPTALPDDGIFGVYKDASRNLVIVAASDPKNMEKPQAQQLPWQETEWPADADESSGTRIAFQVKNLGFDIVTWQKENWGYMVFTTNTVTLDFLKDFRPTQ